MKIIVILKWGDYGDNVRIYKIFSDIDTATKYMDDKYIKLDGRGEAQWRDCGEKPCTLDPNGRDCENYWFASSKHEVEK